MKEERYFYVPDAATATELPQEEAMHALRVLRLAEGDEISLVDGEGTLYKAVITAATGKHCHLTYRNDCHSNVRGRDACT